MKLLLPLREMSFAFNPDATLCIFCYIQCKVTPIPVSCRPADLEQRGDERHFCPLLRRGAEPRRASVHGGAGTPQKRRKTV